MYCLYFKVSESEQRTREKGVEKEGNRDQSGIGKRVIDLRKQLRDIDYKLPMKMYKTQLCSINYIFMFPRRMH